MIRGETATLTRSNRQRREKKAKEMSGKVDGVETADGAGN